MMENQELPPEVKPKNIGKKILILSAGLLILIFLIALVDYFYFQPAPPPSPEPEPQANDNLFTEEFLEKLGHPERYYYLNGVVKEVNKTDKIIYMDSSFSGSFLSSSPQPSEPYKVHVLVKDDTELTMISIFFDQPQSESNPVPKTETVQITFQDIKVGDNISVSVLPEEADKLDNFEAERIQVQQTLGQ